MSNSVNKFKWIKIDDNYEEAYLNNIRFVRPVNQINISLSCSFCKCLISSIEDVEQMKKNNKCYTCGNNY